MLLPLLDWLIDTPWALAVTLGTLGLTVLLVAMGPGERER